MLHDVLIVGAGIAGLTLARELRARGHSPIVLERARGVGGRCATRRIFEQPVDHGLAFLHGRGASFLAELDALADPHKIPGWPRTWDGDGTPCQPVAFDGQSRRLALASGVSRFAKHLAHGSDVRLSHEVTGIRMLPSPDRVWELSLTSGETLRAPCVALTMPASSVGALLKAMDPVPAEIAAILPLLDLVHLLPCLTVIARYPPGTAAPAWDASFPRASAAIQTILHDSSKRPGPERVVLVIQARPRFSRVHLENLVVSWTHELLEEAAALHGHWVAQPEIVQSHIWRKARVAPGSQLTQPLAVKLDSGAVLGIAGDGLHAAGGVEGAYLSGLALAARFREMRLHI